MKKFNEFFFKENMDDMWEQAQRAATRAAERAAIENCLCDDPYPYHIFIECKEKQGVCIDFIKFLIKENHGTHHPTNPKKHTLEFDDIIPASNPYSHITCGRIQIKCLAAFKKKLKEFGCKDTIILPNEQKL